MIERYFFADKLIRGGLNVDVGLAGEAHDCGGRDDNPLPAWTRHRNTGRNGEAWPEPEVRVSQPEDERLSVRRRIRCRRHAHPIGEYGRVFVAHRHDARSRDREWYMLSHWHIHARK